MHTGTESANKAVSNPFCGADSSMAIHLSSCAGASSAASNEQTMGWTLATMDQSGRVVSSSTYDGAAPPAPFGGNSTVTGIIGNVYFASVSDSSASPNAPPLSYTKTTDQTGNVMVRGADGLGRLAWVEENPGGGALYATRYAYDPLDDLTGVTQSSQGRTFSYDSLKRLVLANNPESGATTYGYDSDGNLHTKTDVRGNTLTYAYDGLNRMMSKSYTVASNTAATANVTYGYDNAGAYSIGQLTSVSNGTGGSSTSYGLFDPLGRAGASSQTTGARPTRSVIVPTWRGR